VEILNLGGAAKGNSSAPKSRKKLHVVLGVGALAAVLGIGSTLAANIALNGGGNVEFGQGVATTAACDNDITLTPVSTFSNTEEDSAFAMTAIQLTGIDLSPEGWDVTLNAGSGGWSLGFTPGYVDGITNEWVDGFWDPAQSEHAGKYYDGTDWTNTCANKSIILRAYTDDSSYAIRTAGNNVSSPLLLNGFNNERPIHGDFNGNWYSANSGVGFRFVSGSFEGDYGSIYWALEDCDYRCVASAVHIERTWSGENLWEDSTVTIELNRDETTPPADSRWVDKLTIESAAVTPNNWNSEN
jgi:hypothetical protein